MISQASIDRFWRKVDKAAGPDACWPWTGERFRCGYGRVRIDWRKHPAHRVSLSMATGQWPPSDTYALHSCDNRLCVNPAHLRWGTARDNTADMHRRGRQGDCAVHGESNGRAKLTADDIRAIRAAPKGGQRLADQFGVTYASIKRIRRGDGWKHI